MNQWSGKLVHWKLQNTIEEIKDDPNNGSAFLILKMKINLEKSQFSILNLIQGSSNQDCVVLVWMWAQLLSCVRLCQTPQSIRFPRQESWSGMPFLSPRDLPNPGIEPMFPALALDYLCKTCSAHSQDYWETQTR